MNRDTPWSRIESIFHGALERKAADRAEYIRRECAGDHDLRTRVEALLACDDQTSPVDMPLVAPSEQRVLGHYRLLSKLGQGGMGTVYLARDTRLDREVALKVLSGDVKGDTERKRRFIGEARAASALNHPNIVTLHDVGTDGNLDYLVMEYVDGKPLDSLMPRNGMKVNEALRYAIQIADALACAHRAGIVHRDLKPANVLITGNGVAKVVDFGIAKHLRPRPGPATQTLDGQILGTVAYMSPEQAEGKPVDARSDIFSFGSLLYEMVTGSHPFHCESVASTIAAVLREDPKPVSSLAEDIPQQVAELIHRCLRKLPTDRFQDMGSVKAALERITPDLDQRLFGASRRRVRAWVILPSAAALAVIAIAAALLWDSRDKQEPTLTAVPLTTYPGAESNASFSPDGSQVAFSWCKYELAPPYDYNYPNQCNIYVKQIGEEPPSALTSGPVKDMSPAWSPDGKWIAFLRLNSSAKLALVVVPQRGGRERVLVEHNLSGTADMPPGPHLSWTPDSRWVVSTTPGRRAWFLSLSAVDSDEKRVLTRPPELGWYGDTSPAVSDDGRTLAFSRYEHGFRLFTVRLSGYAVNGEPVPVPTGVSWSIGPAWLPDAGTFVFASKWLGEDGLWRKSLSNSANAHRLPFAPAFAAEPAVSRGGKRLAYTAYRWDTNIWRIELAGAGGGPDAPAPLIASTKRDGGPACSPDGKRIAFISERSGASEVWVCARDGSNPQQLTSVESGVMFGPQWSPDGRSIAVTLSKGAGADVGVIDAKTGNVRPLQISGKWPSWSPDGQWVYFAANTPPTSIWKVRLDGGARVRLTSGSDDDVPQLSPDGKFLYYNKGWPRPLSIWRIPFEGGEAVKILDDVSTGGQWTVGRAGIYFCTVPDEKGRSEIRLYELPSGRTRKIASVDRPIEMKLAISPGDRTLFYPQFDDQGSDLMLIENFR